MNQEYYHRGIPPKFDSFYEEFARWALKSAMDTRPVCATCGLRVHHGDVVEHADLHAEQATRQYPDVP